MPSSSTAAHDSLLFELDEEDANANPTITPNAHEFLNFSRRITERSLKKPVDTQVGIAYGKDLPFSHRSILLRNAAAVNVSSPLFHNKMTAQTTIHPKVMLHKMKPTQHYQPPSSPPAGIGKGSSLDELVAGVLNYIESCPDQSAYSHDLALLKPKLEAINSDKTQL